MKKFAIGCAMLMVGSQAFAVDGEITITGAVTATTCTINGGAADIAITLPTVSVAALSEVGDQAGRTRFPISLTNCTPASGNVTTFFESGPTIDPLTGKLLNTATNGASNLQVALENWDQTAIDLSAGAGNQGAIVVPISAAGSAVLEYNALYVATGAVTAGPVQTSVMYSLDYN